ncbi:MAG TPA: cytochrome c [Tepidisphaeraceae bacterium]|nr:cytochrome c [Tepidisphaeraceae bacterium]
MRTRRFTFAPLLLVAAALAVAGCEREDMHNQARYEPLEESEFFADGQSSRPLVAGTVAQGQVLRDDPRVNARTTSNEYAQTYPFPIARTDLERGRQRYDIYCSMCHGATGYGDGMVVRRGFVKPPSLHDDRLREAAPGYFYEVITNGIGAMYSYNDRIPIEDRWRIAAYVKTLQFSRRVEVASLPPEAQQRLQQAASDPQAQGAATPDHGARPPGAPATEGVRQ